MTHEPFYTFVEGEETRFTILEYIENNITYYYARAVKKHLIKPEQNGVLVHDKNGNVIIYGDSQKLKEDIIAKYDKKEIVTEFIYNGFLN